jgi:hypothetical protein
MKTHLPRLHTQTGGQAMTEFIIVFPVLFLMFLVIIQTALLMTARQVVEYAAFSAARSAIVYDGDEIKNKRAADIACIAISPKMTPGTLAALRDFAVGLGDTVLNTVDLLADHPELSQVLLTWETIPGMEIIEKLRDVDFSQIIPESALKLTEGLLIIDLLCRSKHDVPLRYPSAALLNILEVSASNENQDATVHVTHHYAMRVPLANKLFFYAYLYGTLRSQIREEFSDLPQGAVNEITSAAISRITALANASPNASLYLMPIKADSTLTIEKDANTTEICS